jgi:ribosomal protein S18 acetylase RimI-like enzyme
VSRAAVQIRQGRSEDLDAALRVDERRDDPSRRAELAQALEEGSCWLAERDGRAVGLAVFDRRFFGYPFVWLITVSPDQRRTGVASALVRYIESACRSDRLFSSTNESNLASRSLFERLGFRCTGVVDGLDENDPELSTSSAWGLVAGRARGGAHGPRGTAAGDPGAPGARGSGGA